ncbi:MAG: EAL domain-containing protein [Hylemonella sp.]|uniref:bifunctional diguanylate cyclase/phosphodiesterase n=1 Tax=Hylemonella sp. TaxID=2066020 RepID=UPI0022C236D2|nr:EAL domain-containing protein [Hylemonella sp.]MCZ8254008.1 EAL domain-containing protein [Hylemonella sp.]
MFRNRRLRTWLLLLIVMAVLPAIALQLYSHARDQREALQRTRQDLQSVAGLAASSLEQSIEGVRQILGTIASGPSVRRSDLAQLCQEFIANVAAASPAYTSIGVLTLEGQLRCVGPPTTMAFNARDRNYFREALRTEDFTIGEFVVGRGSGRPALVFSVPVYDYGQQLKGVAYVGLDLARVDQRLKDLRLSGTIQAYLMDASGLLLASTQAPPAAIGQPVPDPGLREAVRASQEGEFETMDAAGARYLNVLVPVGEPQRTRVYVAVSAQREQVLGPGIAQLRRNLAVLLAGTLLGVFFALWLANRQVARPMAHLMARMQAAGRGEAAAQVAEPGVSVEFQQLNAGLSRMLEQLQLQKAAVMASTEGIVICDALQDDHPMVFVNPAFERMTGYSAAEVLGRNCRFLHGEDREQPGLEELRLVLREHRPAEVTLRNYRRDGSLFWNNLRLAPVRDADGRVTHYVGIQTDVSERVSHEQELAHRAHHDMLTGLPNRQLLEDRLAQAIHQGQRGGAPFSVAFIDLDNFKTFNDSIGHTAGDEVLKTVARRLSAGVRPGDTVSRLGGDEFVILFAGIGDSAELVQAVERLRVALAEPLELQGKEYFVAASIGLAIFPHDGSTVMELIQHADFAMYRAKADGRGVVRSYQPDHNVGGEQRLELARDLRKALAQQEFELHYQPQKDTVSGRLVGFEALVRWRRGGELVSPLQFIALAEQTGVILPLGEWVLEEACRQNQQWRLEGVCHVPVAVNVSGIQFKQSDLVEVVERVLARTGLPPPLLHLEITESVMMDQPEVISRTLDALLARGVGVALDDFGTGYSSLSYLKRFPVDCVKIDRSFVRDITTDPMDAAICGAIIAMAHQMSMRVIAEGVETEEQAAFLRAKGCDVLQGYLVGRPLPAEAVWAAV